MSRSVTRMTRKSAAESAAATWQTIVEDLQLEIILGRLQPREHLSEDDVMGRYGASRYAVRRALDELQTLGLAVRTENRGTRIRGYTRHEVEDLYDLRELLETGAALRIRMPIAPSLVNELTRIQDLHDDATRLGDYFRIYTLNNEFHRVLFSACSNVLLSEQIAAYSLQVQPVRMRFVNDERRKREVGQEHREMIDALEKGDSKGLARICGAHLSRSKAVYMKHLMHRDDEPQSPKLGKSIIREASND